MVTFPFSKSMYMLEAARLSNNYILNINMMLIMFVLCARAWQRQLMLWYLDRRAGFVWYWLDQLGTCLFLVSAYLNSGITWRKHQILIIFGVIFGLLTENWPVPKKLGGNQSKNHEASIRLHGCLPCTSSVFHHVASLSHPLLRERKDERPVKGKTPSSNSS